MLSRSRHGVPYRRELLRELDAQSVEAVVLACTELPLLGPLLEPASRSSTLPVPSVRLLDPTQLLAAELFRDS